MGRIATPRRACRWRVLLNAEGTVGVSTVFWATAVGLFGMASPGNFIPPGESGFHALPIDLTGGSVETQHFTTELVVVPRGQAAEHLRMIATPESLDVVADDCLACRHISPVARLRVGPLPTSA